MPVEPFDIPANARKYLGNIVGNAWSDFTGRGRGSATAALWQAIQETSERLGVPKPTFREVNQVRAWASQQPASMRRFGRADSSETDLSGMVSTVSRSRPLAQRDASPRYLAYWRMQYQTGEGPVTEWRVSALGRSLPGSVGDLRDQLTEIASQGLFGSPPTEAEFTGDAFIAAM